MEPQDVKENQETPPLAPPHHDPVDAFRMPLWDHLDDLRKVVVRSMLSLGVGLLLTYNFSEKIVRFLEKPLLDVLPENNRHLYFTGVADKFLVYFKISMLASFILTSPYILYQVWGFISPALYRKEKKFVIPFLFSGTFAFITGLAFSFYVVVPLGYKFLIQFGGDSDQAMITLTEYFSLTLKLMLAIGLIFETPVILVLLSRFGIVDAPMLSRYRRHAIIASAFIAAVATPSPDAFTMIIVMVPLWMLYEISIITIRLTTPKIKK